LRREPVSVRLLKKIPTKIKAPSKFNQRHSLCSMPKGSITEDGK
jgi:hypothetical protein